MTAAFLAAAAVAMAVPQQRTFLLLLGWGDRLSGVDASADSVSQDTRLHDCVVVVGAVTPLWCVA